MILIDPKSRSIVETDLATPPEGFLIPGLGGVCHKPLAVNTPGIKPFFFEPTGLMLGPVIIVEPQVGIDEIRKLVTWVSCLMVINGATLIIPSRGTA